MCSSSRVCHVMFHSEWCLNNVLHFFIVPVSLRSHFCSMTSIMHQLVSECYDRMDPLCCWREAMAFNVKVNSIEMLCTCYTSICHGFTMKDTWFGLMHLPFLQKHNITAVATPTNSSTQSTTITIIGTVHD